MPGPQDLEAIDSQSYNGFHGATDLGYFKTGTLKVTVNDERVDINNIDQLPGMAEVIVQGQSGSIEATIMASPEVLGQKLFRKRLKTVIGPNGEVSIRGGTQKVKAFKTSAAPFIFHPKDQPIEEQGGDIAFYRTAIFFKDFTIMGNREEAQEIQIIIEFGPDPSRLPDENTWAIGHPFVVQAVPKGVWIATGERAQIPAIHLDGFDLSVDEKQQMQAYAGFSNASAISAAINEAGDITAAQKVFNFDTLNTGTGVKIGDYIEIGTEMTRVEDIDYSQGVDDTDGEITLNRGVWGTVAAAHLDDAVMAVQKNVAIQNVTNQAQWSSTLPLIVSAGNTFSGQDFTGVNKGLLTGIIVGGPVTIEATLNTTTSPAFIANVT